MRALLISEYGALNGGELSLLASLPKLLATGFRFTAALPDDSDFACQLSAHGIPIEPFSFHSIDGQRKPQHEIRSRVHNLIRDIKPDIVHANSLAAGRILGPVTAGLNVIGLGYLRDIIKLSKKAIDDISQLDQIVAVSHATAEFHIAQGMPAEKIDVIHNGVDLNRFSPLESHAKNLGLTKSIICLCVGQIGMRKGVDLTLEMVSNVFRQTGGGNLWIVGERHSRKQEAIEYEARLHAFANTNFPNGSVKWMGRRDDIPELMRQADILVHGAKQEPLGRVLLEAAACGLPMVTTNVGGTPEILEGLEELMFDPNSFIDAARQVIKLHTDTQYHRDMSGSLRKIAERKFSSDLAGDRLLRCYMNLLGK